MSFVANKCLLFNVITSNVNHMLENQLKKSSNTIFKQTLFKSNFFPIRWNKDWNDWIFGSKYCHNGYLVLILSFVTL